MKAYKNLPEYLKLFFSMVFIWIFDFISTYFALQKDGVTEFNIFPSFLLEEGGFMGLFFGMVIIIFIFSFVYQKLIDSINKDSKSKGKGLEGDKYRKGFLIFFYTLELIVIVNNIIILI